MWSLLPSSSSSTHTPQRWPAGGRGGEEGKHATVPGKGWAGAARGTEFSAPGTPVITSAHYHIDPCSRGNTGSSALSISPPAPAWVLVPFGGGPTSCANGVGHSGMSREPGEAGPAHRGWDGEEGVHTDIRRGGREGLGGSWGPRQLAGLGSRGEGPGQMVI